MQTQMEDIQISEAILDAVRRYDAAMSLAVPESEHADVNKYLVYPLRNYLRSSGKRLRPLLCELGCELVGGERAWVEPVGRAIESFHSAALIHDDIEDASSLRRGLPAYHVVEGVSCGINAGDYGLALAFKLLLDCPGYSDALRLRIVREFVDTALRTIEGQAVDIGWARDRRFDVAVEECLFVCEAKSAYYTCAAPLAVGAIVGGGSEMQIEALRTVGLSVGVAFQLKDDLLNIESDTIITGKDAFSDFAEGKRTALVAHALEHSPRAGELHDILERGATGDDDIHRALGILEEAGSIGYVRNLMERLCEDAKSTLMGQFGESAARSALCALVDYLKDRMH